MRDALPDLLHGTLPADRQVEVRAHVSGCAACRAELALLARVRDAVTAPGIAAGRVVSRLPRYERQTAWRRLASARAPRIAAAIIVLAGGALLVLRNAGRTPERMSVDSTRSGTPTELALGETFADVSDSALVDLVEAMADLEPLLSEDPETIALPLLPAEGL